MRSSVMVATVATVAASIFFHDEACPAGRLSRRSVMAREAQRPRLDIRPPPEQFAIDACRTDVPGWGLTIRARLKFRPGRSLASDSAWSGDHGNRYLAGKRWVCSSAGANRAVSGDP